MLTTLLLLTQLTVSPKVPDARLTPGAVRPMSQQTVCATTWSLDRRYVTDRMKRQVLAMYGLTWEQRGTVEIDHIVPRALAGADHIDNLWPQPVHEARKLKDVLEVKLWRLTCAGTLRLADAQRAIRRDWVGAYRRFIGPLPTKD